MNIDNTPMDLDPLLANQLFDGGAILVITGVPVGTEFGIDLCSYTVDKKFRGVKMIPPGIHYVWCAAQGPYGDSAPRVGFVHYFSAQEVVVREWSDETEELCESTASDRATELNRITANMRELERFLAAYDYRHIQKWKQLTDCVTASGVARCQPSLGVIRTSVEMQSCTDADRPRGGIKSAPTQPGGRFVEESDLLPNLKPVEGTAPRFTEAPSRIPRNSAPNDISRHSMDCVAAIDTLMSSFDEPDALIEELQLAYIFFLVGHSVESLEQWRKIVYLLANSQSAVDKYKSFYLKYTELLSYQLPHLPEELMDPSERNTVYRDVRSLLVNLYACGLSRSAELLQKRLRKSLGWRFRGLLDEDPDEQPVVVNITLSSRQ